MLTTHNLSLEGEGNVAEGEDGADILHGLGRREAVSRRVALGIDGLQMGSVNENILRAIYTAPP